MKNRREFLIKSALGATGLALAPSWLQGAPAIIKSWNKPDSLINGVQIGCITYSFRSLPDQSAEATLQYVKDCGISAISIVSTCKSDTYGCTSASRERFVGRHEARAQVAQQPSSGPHPRRS